MESFASNAAPIRSALFVDFDNIYIGLSKSDPQAAERFASDPARWLNWLERGLPGRADGKAGPPRERSILVRRCYPNPDAGFRRFRSFFTSAAFAVTDCPTLTRTGKNSSDIYMVMDILDLLNHKTYFDEFIIFSGDSDFMPVLLRLRAHDRRTTTLAIDFMPPAYKAACDLVISEEEFIEEALGVSHDTSCGGPGRGRVSLVTVKEMALRVYEAACTSGEVAGADLPDILKDFREFRDSNNWLGYGTSQRLAEALACSEPRLNLVRLNATLYKLVVKPLIVKSDASPAPEKIQPIADRFQPVRKDRPVLDRPQSVEPSHLEPRAPAEKDKRPAGVKPNGNRVEKDTAPVEKPVKLEPARLREKVIAIVREIVAGSRTPVLLARVSQQVVNRLGAQVLESQWGGAGSFKRLLQNTPDLGLEISTQPEPGYIFDPQRHTHPQALREQRPAGEPSTAPSTDSLEHVDEKQAEHGPAKDVGMAGIEAQSETVPEAVEEARNLLPSDGEPTLADTQPDYAASAMTEAYEDEEEAESDDEDEDDSGNDYSDQAPPSIEELAQRVSRVTGVPDLSSEEYALVFTGIVNELHQIAQGDKTYSTYQSSKSVSDWCAERGVPISRSDIVLIFKGIIFQDGGRFGKQPGSYTERDLASVVCANIRALCKRARLELTEYEDHLLEEWITSGLEDIESADNNGAEGPAVDEPGTVEAAAPADAAPVDEVQSPTTASDPEVPAAEDPAPGE